MTGQQDPNKARKQISSCASCKSPASNSHQIMQQLFGPKKQAVFSRLEGLDDDRVASNKVANARVENRTRHERVIKSLPSSSNSATDHRASRLLLRLVRAGRDMELAAREAGDRAKEQTRENRGESDKASRAPPVQMLFRTLRYDQFCARLVRGSAKMQE